MKMKAIYKALVWYCWNTFFGLAPILIFGLLWIIGQGNRLSQPIKGEIVHLIKDNVILFYCIALKSNISIDLLFSKYRYSNYLYFLMGILPFPLLVIVSSYSVASFFGYGVSSDIKNLIMIQIGWFVVTTLYAIIIKAHLINKDKNFKSWTN